ncbi:hypothetical protein L9F63_013490, partial [Diploptera punctata]
TLYKSVCRVVFLTPSVCDRCSKQCITYSEFAKHFTNSSKYVQINRTLKVTVKGVNWIRVLR